MSRSTRRVSCLAVAATIAVTVGVCAVDASVMAPLALRGVSPWILVAGGSLALVLGLAGMWVLVRRRDRDLW